MALLVSRRELLSGIGAVVTSAAFPPLPAHSFLDSHQGTGAPRLQSPFRVAVINDEISQDFAHVCEVASREFGMSWIELRGMWDKNLLKLDAKEIAEAKSILQKNQLRVTDIAARCSRLTGPALHNPSTAPNAISSTPTLPSNSRTKCSIAVSSWQKCSVPIGYAYLISGASMIRRPIAPP